MLSKEWEMLTATPSPDSMRFRWALALLDVAGKNAVPRHAIERVLSWSAESRSLKDYIDKWETPSHALLVPRLKGSHLLGTLSWSSFSGSDVEFSEWLSQQDFDDLDCLDVRTDRGDIPISLTDSVWFTGLSRISLRGDCLDLGLRQLSNKYVKRLESVTLEIFASDIPDRLPSWLDLAKQVGRSVQIEISVWDDVGAALLLQLPCDAVALYSIRANGVSLVDGVFDQYANNISEVSFEDCVLSSQLMRSLFNREKFPNLKSLSFNDTSTMAAEGSRSTLPTAPCAVTHLQCHGSTDITQHVSPECMENLECLDLSLCDMSSIINWVGRLPNNERLKGMRLSFPASQAFSVTPLFSRNWPSLQRFATSRQSVDTGFIRKLRTSFSSKSIKSLQLSHCNLRDGALRALCDDCPFGNLHSLMLAFSWPSLEDAVHFCRSSMASQLHSLLAFDVNPQERLTFLRTIVENSQLARLLEWSLPFVDQWDEGVADALAESQIVRHLDMVRVDSHKEEFISKLLHSTRIRSVLRAILSLS